MNKNNMKNTWRNINKIIGKGKKADIPENCSDGQEVYSNPRDIANSFNPYFTDIGASRGNKNSPTNMHFRDYLHNSNTSSFFLVPTNYF